MKTFRQFTLTESAAHLTHFEDTILYGGAKATLDAIESLEAILDSVSGSAKKEIDVNVKMDGAPAVFVGTDPEDGQFFVAKKSIFNKVPKVYKTHEDIDADTKGDLNKKLHIALDELAPLGIKGILHGDFLYAKDDLEIKEIDGTMMITFQPNTIVYAVPVDSPLGKKILKSKIGVAWHTEYTGDSLSTLQAAGSADISYLSERPSVWMQQGKVRDLSGNIMMTADDSKVLRKKLSNCSKLVSQIGKNTLDFLQQRPEIARTLETYNNSKVRKGEFIKDPKQHVKGLLAWLEEKHNKDIDSKKSERGKKTARARRDAVMEFFSKDNVKNLIKIYELQKNLVDVKLAIMQHLNHLGNFKTLVRTVKGFEYVGQEGFVIYDRHGSSMLKLVDRLEFSHNNFSDDVLKPWH